MKLVTDTSKTGTLSLVAAVAAVTLAAFSPALADSTTIIQEGPREVLRDPGAAYEDGSDVKVEQWTEDGKVKQEIHYDNGCRKSVSKDLATGDEKVVYHEGCTEEDDD